MEVWRILYSIAYVSDDEEDIIDPELAMLGPDLQNTEEYRELVQLLKIQKKMERKKREKIVEADELIIHEGYKVFKTLLQVDDISATRVEWTR